jgi:hypothetical protein
VGGAAYYRATGNKTVAGFGGQDYWLVKLDAAGNKVFEQTHGGSSDDLLHSMVATRDGGYLLGDESASAANGDKTAPNLGGKDFWLVKTDSSGARVWDRS